jgi:hypothetical protein
MSIHLSELELENLLQRGRSALSNEKIQHFDSCKSCQTLFEEQCQTDQVLNKLSPMKTRMKFIESVPVKIAELKSPNRTKKNDWFFIFSLAVLIVTLLILIIQYPLPDFLTIPLNDISNILSKSVEPITKSLEGINLPLSGEKKVGLKFPGGFLFLIIGIISALFYYVIDSILFRRILK